MLVELPSSNSYRDFVGGIPLACRTACLMQGREVYLLLFYTLKRRGHYAFVLLRVLPVPCATMTVWDLRTSQAQQELREHVTSEHCEWHRLLGLSLCERLKCYAMYQMML
jgi:hypothetical protein